MLEILLRRLWLMVLLLSYLLIPFTARDVILAAIPNESLDKIRS
jgi:hypothetical protein